MAMYKYFLFKTFSFKFRVKILALSGSNIGYEQAMVLPPYYRFIRYCVFQENTNSINKHY
jgi:hypothetical protein